MTDDEELAFLKREFLESPLTPKYLDTMKEWEREMILEGFPPEERPEWFSKKLLKKKT